MVGFCHGTGCRCLATLILVPCQSVPVWPDLDPHPWGPTLGSFYLFYPLMLLPPVFAGCVALGRASSRPLLSANAVEQARLGNRWLYGALFQVEEKPWSFLAWAFSWIDSLKSPQRPLSTVIWALNPLPPALHGRCRVCASPLPHSAEL